MYLFLVHLDTMVHLQVYLKVFALDLAMLDTIVHHKEQQLAKHYITHQH